MAKRTKSSYVEESRELVRRALRRNPDYGNPEAGKYASPPCGHAFLRYSIPPPPRLTVTKKGK